MTSIYRYQPVITEGPNGTDFRPRAESPEHTLIELAVVDGWRYIAVPDGATVIVPEEIETWEQVILTPELRETLKAVSPHTRLALAQFIEAVRARFSLDDELYFARIATGALMGSYTFEPGEAELLADYQRHVEACRAVLKSRYTELGL